MLVLKKAKIKNKNGNAKNGKMEALNTKLCIQTKRIYRARAATSRPARGAATWAAPAVGTEVDLTTPVPEAAPVAVATVPFLWLLAAAAAAKMATTAENCILMDLKGGWLIKVWRKW